MALRTLVLALLFGHASSIRIREDDPVKGSVEAALALTDIHAVCRLDAENVQMTIESRFGTFDAPRQETPHPILCRVVSKDTTEVPPVGDKVAVLSVFSTVHYMFKGEDEGLNQNFYATVNKLHHCEETGRPFFIFIGDQQELRDQRNAISDPNCACDPVNPVRYCGEAGNHYLKPLSELALMKHLGVAGVMYIDADAWFHNTSSTSIEQYLNLSPGVDIVFTQGRIKAFGILMNGGMQIMKNTKYSQDFIQGWWDNRCGLYDQKPLWRTVFQRLKAESGGDFDYDAEKMIGKKYINDYHLQHIQDHTRKNSNFLHSIQGAWSCKDGSCWDGVHLKEPLQLGHLLVLPSAKVQTEQGVTRGLIQDDSGDSVFVCHAHIRNRADGEENGCNAREICADGKCGKGVSIVLKEGSGKAPKGHVHERDS